MGREIIVKLLLLCLAAMALGCPQTGPVLYPADPPCDNACKVLAFYECEEAMPVKIGTRLRSCAERCRQVEASGYISVEPACVVKHSDSLPDIRSLCGYTCAKGRP